MISRQRIRLPHSYDLYYDVLDLNIGYDVTFHGKVFRVSTKNIYNEIKPFLVNS